MAKFNNLQFKELLKSKNYDEALKYLKHNLSKDNLNYYLYYDGLYRSMCSETLDYGKEYKKYHELYVKNSQLNKTIKKEDLFWLHYGTYLINESISPSKKVKNKKKLIEGSNYIEEFIKESHSFEPYFLSKKGKELLFDVFSNESYELNKLYIAYLINPFAHDDFINEFTLEQINILLSLDDSSVKDDLKTYLKVLKKYKFGQCDDETRVTMANYLTEKNKFCEQNINTALSLLMESYNNNYPGTFEKIIDLFDGDKLVRSNKLNFLKNHIKKHSNDLKAVLIYADELYYLSNQKKKVDLKLLSKSLEIYLDNENILTDEQNDRLSYAYLNGCGLEKNHDLAFKYAKSKKARNLLFLDDIEAFKNLKFVNDEYKDQVYDLVNGYLDDDIKKLFKLLNILHQHTLVEANDELFYLLTCKLNDISPKTYGAVSMAYIYLEGIGVSKSLDEFNKYLLIGLQNNFSEAYLLKAYYLLVNNTSLNEVESILDKAVELGSSNAEVLYAIKFGDKYPSKSFDFLIHSYNSKNVYATKLLGQFYEKGIGTDIDYDKAIKYYAEYAYKAYEPSYYYKISQLYKKIGNEEKTFKFLQMSCDHKVAEGINEIISLLSCRKRNAFEEKLLEKYQKIGEEISISSCLYTKGKSLEKTSKEEAVEYYLKSAGSGYTLGYLDAANMYYQLKDFENSKVYYTKALTYNYQGSLMGILNCEVSLNHDLTFVYQLASSYNESCEKDIVLGNIYFYGSNTLQKDYQKSLALAIKHQESKDMYGLLSCKLIGKIYHVQENYPKALAYFKKAYKIKNDDKEVNEWLGYYYSSDNDELSIKHYLKAIEDDSEIALYNLAMHYKKNKDYSKALEYANIGLSNGYDYFLLLITNILIDINDYEKLEKIVKLNKQNKYVSYPSGYMHYHGFNVLSDKTIAYKNFIKAYNVITKGNINDISFSYLHIVTYYLGLCYFYGYGTDASNDLAMKYFNDAFRYSNCTDTKAKKYLDKLSNN